MIEAGHSGSGERIRRLGAFVLVWVVVALSNVVLLLPAVAGWMGPMSGPREWGRPFDAFLVTWALTSTGLFLTLAAALWITRFLLSYRARAAKAAVVLILLGCGGYALHGWSGAPDGTPTPALVPKGAGPRPAARAADDGRLWAEVPGRARGGDTHATEGSPERPEAALPGTEDVSEGEVSEEEGGASPPRASAGRGEDGG